MNKIIQTIIGLAAGLFIVLVLNPFVQAFFADMLISESAAFWGGFFAVISPLLTSILFIELGMLMMINKNTDQIKIVLIVFILVNSGYLIVSLVKGIIAVLFEGTATHELVSLLKSSDYTYNQQLIFMLMFAILLLAYVNIILKRMKRYLPTVVQNKNGKVK